MEKMQQVIIQAVQNLCPSADNLTSETVLFGAEGLLDTIGLVNLIVDVEEAILEEYGKTIVLADEQAMSQKTSPFKTVAAFSEYVLKRLNEN